ncbi:MAG: lysophospholipid acyltransferase family protein [Pseudomonadota bacterium]
MPDAMLAEPHAQAGRLTPTQFTYSTQVASRSQKVLIRAIELMGGQPKLKKLYFEHQLNPRHGESFFEAAVRLLKLDVRYDTGMLDLVPRDKPVVFIANHPYGVLDGITLTWLAMKVRPDVKVLSNAVLCQAPEARENLISIDFAPTQQARETTIRSRLEVQSILKSGGAVGIFPGGGVSAAMKPFRGPALELPWAPFTAKMITMSKATVVPLWFSGQNSRAFQLASQLSYTVRLALMFHETARRIGTRLDVSVGQPIAYEQLPQGVERRELVRFLRERTTDLAPSGNRDQLLQEFTRGNW